MDFFQTGERSARLLLRILAHEVNPVSARVPIPAIVRGDELKTATGLFGRCVRKAIEVETGAHWRPALRGAFGLWTAPSPAEPPVEDVPTSAEFAFGLLDPNSDHALARVAPFWTDVWNTPGLGWWLQAGYYDYTPDHRPLLGPSSVPGLALNLGYSGHGIMGSPGGSRRVIDAILGRLEPAANPFRPDRTMVERLHDVL